MPGFANLFYLGQPDPAQQLARMLSGQQQPPQQQPPGAPGAAPPNGPAPGPADGSATPPPPVAPGSPPPPGSPPIPTALQSTPDMSQSYAQLANPPNILSLYVQMQQRDQAMAGINSAFAQIAANHSPPSMRNAIMQNANAGAGDAGAMVGNLMSLRQGMQQQAATQALLAQSPQIAQKLNMDEGIVRAQIMAGRGDELVQALEPTQKTRDIQSEHDLYIKGATAQGQDAATAEANWNKYWMPLIMTGSIPGATGQTRSRIDALAKWNADPNNQGKTPPPYYTSDEKWDLYNKDLDTARGQFGGLKDALGQFVDSAGEIAADPELANITGSPANALKAKVAPGSTAAGVLAAKMSDLGGVAKAMSSRQGPKGVGQNLATLGANPEAYTNFGIADYGENVIAPKIRIALTSLANSYGAAGRTNEMPGYLKPYLDPMFQQGGDLDPGGGYKPFTPSKDLKQPSAEDINDFRYNLEHFGPKKAIQIFKDNKIDTSSLE